MKAKAFILTALLLAPATATAGASAVNPAPAPAAVKVTEANLPVALTDEELDEVTGEWLPVIRAVGGAAVGVATNAAENIASGKAWNDGAVTAAIGGAIPGGGIKTVEKVVTVGVGAGKKVIGTVEKIGVDWVEAGKSVVGGLVGGAVGGGK